MKKTCDVCNAPSGNYPICSKCNKLKNEGKIIKCEKCGKWHYADKPCCNNGVANVSKPAAENKTPSNSSGNCMVCGKTSPNGSLCFNCYKKKELVKKEFEKERTKQQILDHYFAQKAMLYRIKNPNYIENGVLRLIAISEELFLLNSDNYLKDRIDNDVNVLIERKHAKVKKETEEPKSEEVRKSFDDEDYRKQWLAEHQCDDGHYVRSYSELLIDNWLYNNGYVHAYEKSVFMMTEPDAVVLSDFYLPDGDVYIEFWGLNDDQRYLARKEKKIKMYNDNNLKFISLEEADVKRLNDIMPRKLFEYIKK